MSPQDPSNLHSCIAVILDVGVYEGPCLGLLELSKPILLVEEMGLDVLPPVVNGAQREFAWVAVFVTDASCSNSLGDVVLRILKYVYHNRSDITVFVHCRNLNTCLVFAQGHGPERFVFSSLYNCARL